MYIILNTTKAWKKPFALYSIRLARERRLFTLNSIRINLSVGGVHLHYTQYD